MPLKNESGQLITKLAQKLARLAKKQMKNPTHFPPIPTMANGSFLEGNEGNMEEIGGADAKLGKPLEESQVVFFFPGFPQGRNYSGGIGDAWHP